MLILISEAETPMSSGKIAESVGTNSSYIRKIAGLLKKAGMIESSQGRSGFSLSLNADELTLYQIFCAVEETNEIHLFDIHRNPNDKCVVGRYIQPTLTDMFGELEDKAVSQLKQKTLKNCMDLMLDRIGKENAFDNLSK
jgi:Rrf2 family protein